MVYTAAYIHHYLTIEISYTKQRVDQKHPRHASHYDNNTTMSFLSGLQAPVGTTAPLLAPLVTLNLWTFVMELWMYKERIPAMQKYKVQPEPSISASTLEKMLPREVQWPAENYNHLHEQPTFFVSVILTLTYLGARDDLTVYGAWTYVALRIAHSIVQASVNKIPVRFGLFGLSSLTLFGLTVKAATLVF